MSSVYEDKQNAHCETIVDSIREAIDNLKKDPIPDPDECLLSMLASGLSDSTKERLVKDFLNCPTIRQDLSFIQIFSYVWQRIQNPGDLYGISADERRASLEKILELQVNDCYDSEGNVVCFAGRLGRIISVLDGFFDDIRINISDNERISAIIIHTQKLTQPYDPYVHLVQATEALYEAGFTNEQIQPWISEIASEIEVIF